MSEPARLDRVGSSLAALLGLLALASLLTLAHTLALRVGSPYPLEWMEGASLAHALRMLDGQPLYAAPSAEFVPYLYPPLAYLPFAAAAALLGPTLPAARAASLLCLACALLAVGRAATRSAGTRHAGLLAAGIFALGYGYGGAFLDLVRVDAAFIALLCVALERIVAGRLSAALALLALSALAKQHGLVLFALVAGACLWDAPRRHARAVAASSLALLAALLALQVGSGGWFARYVLELPSEHALEPRLLASFVLVDVALYLPVLAASASLAALRGLLSRPLTALLLAALAVSALGRAHPGGDDNVRLPAFAVLCVLGSAPLVARALDARHGALGRCACALGLFAQLAILYQPPAAHAPTASTRASFEALDAALADCARGGRRAALDHALPGHAPIAHTMALSDLALGGPSPLWRQGSRALLHALDGASGPAALAVGERFPALDALLARRYVRCAVLPAPRPPTGYWPGDRRRGAPEQVVYVRADAAAPAPR